MTTQPMGRTKSMKPHIGILAPTSNIATSLAQELGIVNHLPLSPRALSRIRGAKLKTLLVDESLWPLQRDVAETVIPALKTEGGYILRVLRVDPSKAVKVVRKVNS